MLVPGKRLSTRGGVSGGAFRAYVFMLGILFGDTGVLDSGFQT